MRARGRAISLEALEPLDARDARECARESCELAEEKELTLERDVPVLLGWKASARYFSVSLRFGSLPKGLLVPTDGQTYHAMTLNVIVILETRQSGHT